MTDGRMMKDDWLSSMFRCKLIFEDVVIPPLRTPILGKENVGSNMFVLKICTTIKGERLTRGAFYVFSAIGTPVLLLQLYNTVILPRSGHSSRHHISTRHAMAQFSSTLLLLRE